MKLSTSLPYTGDPQAAAARARDLEAAGIDMVWVAELYSFDAVRILGYLAAHTQRVDLGRERIAAYKAAGVTRLAVQPVGDDPLALVEKVRAWAE